MHVHTYVCADIYIYIKIHIYFKIDEEAGGEAKQLLSNWAPSWLGDVGMWEPRLGTGPTLDKHHTGVWAQRSPGDGPGKRAQWRVRSQD